MQKPNSRCKKKTRLKHKYMDVFFVFTVLMITGVLLAISASAQLVQPPEASGEGVFSPPDNLGGVGFNQQPTLIALESDRHSPQEAGSSIIWMAKAEDPENDPMSFMFRLKGPSTGDVWKPVNSGPSDNTWKWDTNSEDAGNYQISVLVKDEMHAGPQFTPDEKTVDFLLTAPPAPQEAQAQPVVEPLPIVPNPEQTYVPQETKPANLAPNHDQLDTDSRQPPGDRFDYHLDSSGQDAERRSLQFMFSMDGQVMQDWSESSVWRWTASVEQVGLHVIEARVRDGTHNQDDDSASSANFEIVLPPNNAPVMSSLTAGSESPQLLGTPVTWTAQANDFESDPISYRFLVNGTPVTDWQSENQWTWTAMQMGTSQISVQAKDSLHEGPQGEGGNMGREFSINAPEPVQEPVITEVVPAEIVPAKLNESPVMSSFTADSESPQLLGTPIIWTAQANDFESDPISYRFLVNGTPVTDWQSENLWTWTAMQLGTSQISVQAKDSLHEGPQGEGGNMGREFSINAPEPVQEPVITEVVPAEVVPAKLNESPVISGFTADSESPQLLGTPIIWTAQANDSESDPISYRFLVNGTPVTDWQSENLWTWTAMQPGTSQISVQAKDSLHEGPQGEGGNMGREFPIIVPVAESITTPIAPENVTIPQQPVNDTETVPIAPETVVPPVNREHNHTYCIGKCDKIGAARQ